MNNLPSADPTPRHRLAVRVCALAAGSIAAALSAWAYWPALSAGFVFDDVTSVVDNPALHWEGVSWDGFRGLFESAWLKRRVVANLSFALNHVAGGLDPTGYHLANILVHLATGAALALLVWVYLRSEGAETPDWQRLASVTVPVTIFLVHPLNTQAVTYVVQRMASLSTFFAVISLATYVAGRRGTLGRKAGLWLAASALFWLLGLGTKENVAILPLVLLTYEWCFHRAYWRERLGAVWAGPTYRRVAMVVIAFSAVGLLTGGLLAFFGGNPFSLTHEWPRRGFNGIERMLTQTRVHWLYLSLLLWPSPGRLNLDYDFIVSRGLLQPPSTLFALLSLALLVAFAFYLAVRRPLLGFPLLAYFEFHALESGPASLEMVFEHRMYLPMTMLAVALAAVINGLRGRMRILIPAGAAVVILLLAVATRARNETWSDPVRFAYDVAQKSPAKPRPQTNLGVAYRNAGRYEEAEAAFRRSLELDPWRWTTHYALGALYLDMGRPEEAEAEFRETVRLSPSATRAAYAVGEAIEAQGRAEEAFHYYLNLGSQRGMAGRAFEAMEPLRRAVALDPASSVAHNSLGNVYSMAGMTEQALIEYRAAVEHAPNNAQAVYNLALLLDRAREFEEAVVMYRRFVEIAPPSLSQTARMAGRRALELESRAGRPLP
ncbi:MAG: tetratricopeptide repeat protein [Gemmatimonadota bacterium]|nr:MAG: tetratricopeptide repeat protein [Gemmatimonadota bacterium]